MPIPALQLRRTLRRPFAMLAIGMMLLASSSCTANMSEETSPSEISASSEGASTVFTASTPITNVINSTAFAGFGDLLFPTQYGEPDGLTLADTGELLPYHSHVNTDTTIDVLDSLKTLSEGGQTVFYDIYTDEEKAADPDKKASGLFFLRGETDAPFAVVNAGGGFSYVGSIHESLPHALYLSRAGYNAFALSYRTGGEQVACEDLARALSFIFEHADELGVSTDHYSLWGGSAGARMAADLGSYGPASYGGDDLPRPATVVIQYTGHSDYTENDPATYAVVGDNDGIANWHTMQERIDNLSNIGIDTEFHHYPNLEHGFGLGIGTSAEGWISDALAFWQKHIDDENR